MLSSQLNRTNYDTLMRSEFIPGKAHDIFEDFFQTKWMDLPD